MNPANELVRQRLTDVSVALQALDDIGCTVRRVDVTDPQRNPRIEIMPPPAATLHGALKFRAQSACSAHRIVRVSRVCGCQVEWRASP